MSTMPLHSVCVFCGAMAGVRPSYVAAARELGYALAQRHIELVYGGGHVGLMGELADAALSAGGRVVGIIPQHLMRPEIAHQHLTELHVVDSMHTRKSQMAQRSAAFIVLPGGYGTLEEMFEMVTWLQLQLHAKPIGALNVDGFFEPLRALLQHTTREGFIRPQHSDLLFLQSDVVALLDELPKRLSAVLRAHPATGSIAQG